MDLYTMNENFLAQTVIDEFISAIWTERYSTHGEVNLVLPATPKLVDELKEGLFLGLRGSKEVMEIQTQIIEDNTLTVTGKSLVNFLDQRLCWFANPESSDADRRIVDYTVEAKVGQAIADVVEAMVIDTTPFGGGYADANLDWELEEIENLEIGAVDTSGDDEKVTFATGPLYAAIAQVAQKHGIGISLYLDSANIETGFVLKFTTYKGLDRTSDQDVNPLVRLTPALDSLSDLKELYSIAAYKNVAYVYYQGEISVHYEDPLNIPEGLARRVLMTDAEGEPVGHKIQAAYPPPGMSWATWYYGPNRFTHTVVGPEDIEAFREQHAKDALANYNYIRSVDGQTSPENEYKFGEDYGLGDIIELENHTGTIAKARVTEYIRSQDKTGEREYPTISVIE